MIQNQFWTDFEPEYCLTKNLTSLEKKQTRMLMSPIHDLKEISQKLMHDLKFSVTRWKTLFSETLRESRTVRIVGSDDYEAVDFEDEMSEEQDSNGSY